MPYLKHDFILASSSPRRKELLTQAGFTFTVISPDIDEQLLDSELPEQMAERLADEKARLVSVANPHALVLGADTIVILREEKGSYCVLGKPVSAEDACKLLGRLQGRSHFVVTAVSLRCKVDDICIVRHFKSKVTFSPLSSSEILEYVQTGEPMDKAGAYAMQGKGCMFVSKIEGSYTNVIGLPVSDLIQMLKDIGVL